MKIIKSLLFVLLFTVQASFAQTFPDPGVNLAVRGAFFDKDKTIDGQAYLKNWYSDTQNVMTKDANNLFSFQIFLPWSQDGGLTAYTYYYTDVFEGQGTVGPRNNTNRKFTLTEDRIVNFYAKAWYNTAFSIYQTQMICDAQKVSYLFYPSGTMAGFTQDLPLPVNGKSSIVINIPIEATGKVEYNVYAESAMPSPFAWMDLNNLANYKQTICQGNKSGRYILMVDYPKVSASTAKVLDGINTPKIKIGSGSFIDPSNVAFSGANLGVFNTTAALKISGSLNAFSTNNPVNVSDVSAKLYYQITKTGYDSGVKTVTLTNGGSTVQAGSVFANTTPQDISAGLENGDYTLKVWYGTTNWSDTLLLDNSGSKYTASFTVTNTHTTGAVNWSSGAFSAGNMNIVVDAGELTIDENAVAESIIVKPGAKLTLNSGYTLNAGALTLESDVTGTATFVDKNTVGTAITAKVQQYLTGGRNWYISSPVGAANSSADYFKYDEKGDNPHLPYTGSETAYWEKVNSGTTLNPFTGYIAQPASTTTVAFTGTLNTGSISATGLTRTALASKPGYNLVGNPYASYVDWNQLTKTNLNGTIWYRAKEGGVYKFYTYNGSTAGYGGGEIGSPANVSNMIPPMQAFWVKVETEPGTLGFANAARAHLIGANPLKAPAVKNTAQQILRLQVSNGTNSDEALVYFNPNASNDFDTYDSPKMSNNNAVIPEIYTMAGSEHLVINGLNSIPVNTELPLGFTTGESNTYSIKATEFSNFEPNANVYLKDKLLGTEHEITDGSAYSFTSDVTSTSTRFSIVFKSASVSSGLSDNSVQGVAIFKNANNQISVNCNGNLSEDAYVTVFNAVGQKLVAKQITSSNTIIANAFTSGVYIVLVNNNGKKSIRKVTFK